MQNNERPDPRVWLVPVALLALAIALPFVAPTYYVQFISKALIMASWRCRSISWSAMAGW